MNTVTTTIDLLSLIEQRSPTRLKRVATTDGGEYAGNCPWCGGTDRFHVWPHSERTKPHFWCRQCNKMGDAIAFLMEYENLEFLEACREMDLEPDDLVYIGTPSTPSPLGASNPAPCKDWQDVATMFIHVAKKALLHTQAARPYLDYLQARGLTLDIIDKKNIGYVPLKDGKWIETPFSQWGLTEEMLTPEQWSKNCVRVPDGLLFPYYGPDGPDGKPWKLSMYRPLAETLPQFKRGLIVGSKECLLNEHLMVVNQDKPIIMTESFLDAISIEQVASDLVVPTSTDGTSSSRSLRCQAQLQYHPFVLQSFDGDEAGEKNALWWYQNIKNCVRWTPVKPHKDTNEMLVAGYDLRQWIEQGIRFVTSTAGTTGVSLPELKADPVDVCFLCKGKLHSYTSSGTPCCERHVAGRIAVEQAMAAYTEYTIQHVPSSDPLTQFATTVDKIADIFAPCTITRDAPGYSINDHAAFLNDKQRRKEIAYEIQMRRIQEDRRYKHLHPEEN